MSLPTALATGLLAVATLGARPDTGVVRVLLQDSAGSWLARRLLPLAVFLPWAVDLTARLGAAVGVYAGGSVGPARLVLGSIALAGVTLTLAKSANRVDARRHAAEQALLEHQHSLEATVAERTRALTESEGRLVRDLAARKVIEAQLRVRAAALEAAHNGIAIVARDGNFEWVNPAFSRLTGYASDEVVGTKPNLLKSGQHDAAFYHELWRTVTSGKVWQGHMINRRKDGTLYDEEQTITPVPDANGTITHFVAIKLDVSERLAAERERERLLGELQEALANVRTLSGFIPICAACKKIRNDTGYWDAIEAYISRHTDAKFSHGICPECIVRLYPDEC
ncbi:MAG: PAS domain S-box protein [Myxococcales bacterium]|nr:PAS domain S-box protein [Myxococcales bacterium]